MRHDLKVLLLKEIDESLAQRRDYLLNGKCATFEDYRRVTGLIEGLNISKNVIESVFERLKVDPDADQ